MTHTCPAVRLVALDLDGTLLNDQKHVSPQNRAALAAAAAVGVHIVPCSGRALDSIPDEVLTLPGVRYVVSSGGGGAWDLQTGTQLLNAPLDVETAVRILRLTRDAGAWGECYTARCSYSPAVDLPAILQFASAGGFPLLARQPVQDLEAWARENAAVLVKLNLIFRDAAARTAVRDTLAAWPQILLSAAGGHNLEVNAAGCGKGDMLRRLGALLGIATGQMMACGDQLNDLNMLQTVGVPVAMGNAVKELKPHAAFVTAANTDHGVARAIEKFVLGL